MSLCGCQPGSFEKEPVYWKCGGGALIVEWAYGYWGGKDNDLLCVIPSIKTDTKAEKYASPICKSKKEAKSEAIRKEGELNENDNELD